MALHISTTCLLVVIVSIVVVTTAYKQGPPVASNPEICKTMTPQHCTTAQATAAPYDITADTDCYKEKGIVTGNYLQTSKKSNHYSSSSVCKNNDIQR